MIAKNLNFALRSLDLNNHRRQLPTLIVDQHESLRSMTDAFKVTLLSTLIENKRRCIQLTQGLERIKHISGIKSLERRNRDALSTKLAIANLLNEFYAKYRNRYLMSVSDLKYWKRLSNSSVQAKKGRILSILHMAVKSKTHRVISQLCNNNDFKRVKLRHLFGQFLSNTRFKTKKCLFALIKNQNLDSFRQAFLKIRANLLIRFLHANKVKMGSALTQLSISNLNEKLNISNRKRRQVEHDMQSVPVIDLDEIDFKHRTELEEARVQMLRSNFVKRLVFAQTVKTKLALRTISLSPFSVSQTDPNIIQKWVFNTLALNYKVKILDASQVLRYPTIKRHQKQKAAQKLELVISNQCVRLQQVVFNSFLKTSQSFDTRYVQLFQRLSNRVSRSLQTGFYSILSNKVQNPEHLIAVNTLKRFLLSKQPTYDSDFKRPCFIKLGSLLDPETPLGDKFNKQNYKFDILIDKRLKLEQEAHPLTLKKINIRCENSNIMKTIEQCKARNVIYTENIKSLNESTQSLELKKKKEIKELISRKILGFSFESELRKLIGDFFGPSKQTKNDNNSLSHANDNYDTSIKVQEFDRSVSKIVELEDSNLPLNLESAKIKCFSDVISTEGIKSNTNFKLNTSDKVLRELESKKILRKIKDMNFDNLSEKDINMFEQTIAKLSASKLELEGLLEKMVNDLNDFQNNNFYDMKKIENIKNRVSVNKQNFVKFEMMLIDMQDRKGMLQLQKTNLGKINEKIRNESEAVQKSINELKNIPTIDASQSVELEKLKSDFFHKFELLQSNSQQILKMNQEILDISQKITQFQEKNAEIKTMGKSFDEQQKSIDKEIKEGNERTNEMRDEVQNILKQISWHSTIIENLEMKKRNIPHDESVISQSGLDFDNYVKFKDHYLKMDNLTIQKIKLLMLKNELKKDQKNIIDEFESVTDALERTALVADRSSESDDKINKLNHKWKKLNLENDILIQKMNKLDADKNELNNQIKVEKSKIIEVINDYDEFDRRTADTGSVNETKGDILRNTMFVTTRLNFDPMEQVENMTVKDNLLNYSKSNINDEHFKQILISKLNHETKELINLTDNNLVMNQPFEDILNLLIQKKGDYLQNKQLSFFNYLKKEEYDDRIKGNSCWILEYKERIAKNEFEIRNCRKQLRQNASKACEVDSLIHKLNAKRLFKPKNALFEQTETTSTQTLVDNTYYNLNFINDKNDFITPQQKTSKHAHLIFIDKAIIPRIRTLTIQKLDTILSRRIGSLKLSKNLLEFEHQDFFDGKNQKIIDEGGLELDLNNSNLRDSLILEEYFPFDATSKKQVKKIAVRNQSIHQISVLNIHSYEQLHHTRRADHKIDSVMKPPPIKKPRDISQANPIFDNKDAFVPTKFKAMESLSKVIPRAIKNYANLSFYHLKLITTNTRLRDLMHALGQFRMNHIGKGYDKVKTELGNQFANSMFELLQSLVLKREKTAFNRIKMIFDAKRKTRNVILTKWMARGDNTMKKHLRLTLQYWKHIKNDNIWNVNILKTMVTKSPLIPQIALWRLMIFKKRDYTCPPKTVKGLLNLMINIDTKQLNKGFKAILNYNPAALKRVNVNDFRIDFKPEKSAPNQNLMTSEFVKDGPSDDFGIKSQKLFSVFSYCAILAKQVKMKYFYQLLKQVKDEFPREHHIRYEYKDVTTDNEGDPGMNTVRFLLDQQIKCKSEILQKDSIITDLQEELNEKNENLLFMKYYLLNFSLMRLERISKRIFNKNVDQSRVVFMRALVEG